MPHRLPIAARLVTLAALLPLAALGGCASGPGVGGSGSPSATGTATSPHYEVSVSLDPPRGLSTAVRMIPLGVGTPSVRYVPGAPSVRVAPPTLVSPPSGSERDGLTPPPTERRSSPTARATTARTTTAPPAPPRTTSPAPFRSSISPIDAALAARMHASYHPGCPVPLADLRSLRLSYWGFDGKPHTGELVVSARVAADVVTAFRSLYEARFPIHRMRPVADYGGSDEASMAADNTSAFNCRRITGGTGWSEHSYGDAIDINPVENPYVSGSTVLPPAGRAYLDRPERPGVIHPGGVAVRAFAAIGWTWGGTWTSPVDLQHFSLSGH